jgi:hypothetical protein
MSNSMVAGHNGSPQRTQRTTQRAQRVLGKHDRGTIEHRILLGPLRPLRPSAISAVKR